MRWCLEAGEREFTVIPFFFGPTGAILDYLPKRLAQLRKKFGDFAIHRIPFLYDETEETGNDGLVSILADNIRATMFRSQIVHPKVALVDHGSPLKSVTDVRNRISVLLQKHMGSEVAELSPASMERRPGEAYAFNEPLLENLLLQDGWSDATVVISMLFLSPGRHAGPEGDVAAICARAESRSPELVTRMTDLVGTHPQIVELLATRLKGRRLPLE